MTCSSAIRSGCAASCSQLGGLVEDKRARVPAQVAGSGRVFEGLSN